MKKLVGIALGLSLVTGTVKSETTAPCLEYKLVHSAVEAEALSEGGKMLDLTPEESRVFLGLLNSVPPITDYAADRLFFVFLPKEGEVYMSFVRAGGAKGPKAKTECVDPLARSLHPQTFLTLLGMMRREIKGKKEEKGI